LTLFGGALRSGPGLKEQSMPFRASALAFALGTLAGTPCLALTVQAAPPRPDVAQHLRPTSAPASSVLPAPSERPQVGLGLRGQASAGTTSFTFGPVRATTTVTPGYGAFWNDRSQRDSGNPLSLVPRRP
jgi:hypothetical protein